MGASTDYTSILCASGKESDHSVNTSFGNKLCGGVWSVGSPFRGGSSIFRIIYRAEGANSGTYTYRKPNNTSDGDDGDEG